MASADREGIRLEDDEGGHLHAVWSRSGKRLIVTVGRRGERAQVELRPAQVGELTRFAEEVDSTPTPSAGTK